MKSKKHPARPIAAVLITAAILASTVSGCDKKSSEKTIENEQMEQSSKEKTSYAYGLDIIALMSEMVNNDDYLHFLSSSPEIQTVSEKVAEGDYENIKAVYRISTPGIESLAASMDEETLTDSFSEELLRYMDHRAASAITSQFNSREGYASLAASSAYTAEKTFVCKELQEDCIYMYIFQKGYPITVSFTVGENGAVHAVGTFLINEEIAAASEEELQSLINEILQFLGCKIEPLEISDAS